MNNTVIFTFSSLRPFFFFDNIFYLCFYHLPWYPLETQQISDISPRDNNVMILSKIRMLTMLLWIFLYVHSFFLWLFHQTSITISITFFMNVKSWKKLLKPKHSTSTFIRNSSNSGLFCFFNFLHTVRFISLFNSILWYIE